MRHWPNVVLLLAHHLRYWLNSKLTLSLCPMFAGNGNLSLVIRTSCLHFSLQKTPKAVKKLDSFKSTPKQSPVSSSRVSASPAVDSQSSQLTGSPQAPLSQSEDDLSSLLWVDKYKPRGLKTIIGQQGDKSNAKKLLHWLKNWHKNVTSGKKPACK